MNVIPRRWSICNEKQIQSLTSLFKQLNSFNDPSSYALKCWMEKQREHHGQRVKIGSKQTYNELLSNCKHLVNSISALDITKLLSDIFNVLFDKLNEKQMEIDTLKTTDSTKVWCKKGISDVIETSVHVLKIVFKNAETTLETGSLAETNNRRKDPSILKHTIWDTYQKPTEVLTLNPKIGNDHIEKALFSTFFHSRSSREESTIRRSKRPMNARPGSMKTPKLNAIEHSEGYSCPYCDVFDTQNSIVQVIEHWKFKQSDEKNRAKNK